ncbi:DNA translocase FtsK [Pararobbsia alpina]|uniref:DNA translocase FtsK n=1 Tax=Pararobbsia alpina TaxID=621374 RepID=UPI003CCCF6F0
MSAIWLVVLVWRLVLARLSGGGAWQGPGTLRTWIGAVCVLLASGVLEAGVWSKLAPASDIDRVGRALLDAFGYGGGGVAGLVGLGVGLPWLFGTRLSTLVLDLIGNTERDPSPQPSSRRAPADWDGRSSGPRSFGLPGSPSGRARRQAETSEIGTAGTTTDRPASSGLRAPGELGSGRRPGTFRSTADRAATLSTAQSAAQSVIRSATQSATHSVDHPVNHSPAHPVHHSASRPTNQKAALSASQPVNVPTKRDGRSERASEKTGTGPMGNTPFAPRVRNPPPAPAAPAVVALQPGIEAKARRAAAAAARRAVSVAGVPTVHASAFGATAALDSAPSARSLAETFRAVEEMASQWPALASAARNPATRPAVGGNKTAVAPVATHAATDAVARAAADAKANPISLAPLTDELRVIPTPDEVMQPSRADEALLVLPEMALEAEQTDVRADMQADAQADVQTHAQVDMQSHPQVDTRPDVQTHAQVDMQSHPQVDTRPDVQTHAQVDVQAHPQTDMQTVQTHARADEQAHPQVDLQDDVQTQARTDELAHAQIGMQQFDMQADTQTSEASGLSGGVSVSLTPHRPLLPPDDDIDVLDGMSLPFVPSLAPPVEPPVVHSSLSRFAPPANEPLIPGFTVQRAPVPSAPPAGQLITEFEFHPPSASHVELPGLDLLASAEDLVEPASEAHLAETGQLIEQRLKEFKVPVTVVGASAGPVITRFEVEPALGVRGAQIVGLMKDLSRGLGLTSIRVVETIPGKTCMGLELPNPKRQMIRLSEILASDAYRASPSHLSIAMGKDITGTPVVTDLARAPHMLVAGTTGSGKSVAINAMILSLLYKAAPADVRLIMIDPKMLELSVYEGIPHLLAPVVTDMKLAANALNWCVGEMEKRYRLMSALGVRNIAGFNQKLRDAERAERKIGNPFSLTPDAPEPLSPLPLIVVIIDELADLMMVAGKKIEELIARLAQKARASGIHLILATQRPSVDVITGLIKANIPTRVAFQVSSKIDSRTILDQMGAESLLGQGDMLFLPPGSGDPQRIHGAFVADDEVHRVVEYLKQFGEPEYESAILDPGPGEGAPADLFGEMPDPEADPLYDEAVAFVLRTRRASISSVQRQLRIGYNRAARLVEQMETAGLVSAMGINGSREVLGAGPAE